MYPYNLLLAIPHVINVITLDVNHYKIGHWEKPFSRHFRMACIFKALSLF